MPPIADPSSAFPTATRLVIEAATSLDCEVEVLDPDYGYLVELRGKTTRRVLLAGRSPLNDAVAARLAEDKYYAGALMARAGLAVPKTARCLSPRHPSLEQYRDRAGVGPGAELAERVGFPLVVKPNRMGHGRGVRLIEDRGALGEAVREAWELDAIALVQERVLGRDFRLEFLDGEYLIGYERRPLSIRGDGTRRIDELFQMVDPRFADPERRRLLAHDPRCAAQLERRGWTLRSVLPEGATLSFEGPIQTLHGPSTPVLLPRVPEGLIAACNKAGAALALRHFGVDLKLGALSDDSSSAVFIELNPSPLSSQVYLAGHREQVVRAQARVLEAILGGK